MNEIKLIIQKGYGDILEDPVVYFGFTNIFIFKSLEELSGSFSIQLTQSNVTNDFDIKAGDKYSLTINDRIFMKGYIDSFSISYSEKSHSIEIEGREVTQDLLDSSLIGNSDLNAPYTPKQLVEHVLNILHLDDDIKVIDETNLTIKYEDNFDSGAGKNAWEQLDKYLQKKSIFATTNSDGDIVLFRGSFGSMDRSIFNTTDANKEFNNVKEATKTSSTKERFHKISVLSQLKTTLTNGFSYEQGGESFSVTDDSIRQSRQIELTANSSLTNDECKDLAEFQKNVRYARSNTYKYILQGLTQSNGELWLPNYEVFVKDEFFGIQDSFLIKSVIFKQNPNTGTTTTLELVDKLAYSLREPVAIQNEEKGVFFAQ